LFLASNLFTVTVCGEHGGSAKIGGYSVTDR